MHVLLHKTFKRPDLLTELLGPTSHLPGMTGHPLGAGALGLTITIPEVFGGGTSVGRVVQTGYRGGRLFNCSFARELRLSFSETKCTDIT